MPVATLNLDAVSPTGITTPVVPVNWVYPVPVFSITVMLSDTVFVMVSSLKAKFSITTAPVPFAEKIKSSFNTVVLITLLFMLIESTCNCGISKLLSVKVAFILPST